jgi:hypothetical protein
MTEIIHSLLSTASSPERFNKVVRQHWGVENRLHWRLDVVMKGPLRVKFKRAGWDRGSLTTLLSLF